jgi:hypothetical protein
VHRPFRIFALLVSLLAPAAGMAGEPLGEAEIASTFRGMTLDGIYRDGEFFSETYNEDGSIRYHGQTGADSGEWSVEGGRFCTFYEGAEGACFFVERDGANCFTFTAPEEKAGRTVPQKDWTSRGWDRTKPSTCPTAPEIEL